MLIITDNLTFLKFNMYNICSLKLACLNVRVISFKWVFLLWKSTGYSTLPSSCQFWWLLSL